MADKLLVEVEMCRNGHAGEAIRALVFLANELIEYSPVEITEPIEWRQKAGDDYRLKWRFSEDALSSWQVVIEADLAVQLTEALRTAQLALNEKGSRRNNTLNGAREAIEKALSVFTESLVTAAPELQNFLCEA
jgi:hypothetical protein